MSDISHDQPSDFPIAGTSEVEQNQAMQLGIAFNGVQFVYRDYKYDKLADAMAYAELDSARNGRQPVASATDWLARPVPSAAEQALMQLLGVHFEDWRYTFQGYHYDRRVDALRYAKRHPS